MAVTSMMQRLLDNALTAKFAKSLNHSDLPEGWADNPEIVQLAEDAYSVLGTESPWFKAWFGDYSPGKAYKFATEGEPVASLTGREFQDDGTSLTDRVVRHYKEEYGGSVERPGLGRVKLNKHAVKDDTFHKTGPTKSAGFATVPDVIQKGEFFTKDYDWKGRGYDTSGYIAPIDINGERFAEEVILKHKPNSTSLYQHEIEPIKKLEDAYKNAVSELMPELAVSTPHDGAASRGTRLILPNVLAKVNPVSKVVDDKGNPLKVYHGSAADNIEVFKPSKTGNLGPAIYTTPDISAAEEFARTHDGSKVYELFVNSKNPLKLSNSLEAGEEFWGKLAGKTEAESIADLQGKGYDGAWAVGRGKSRWGNTAPEIAVYSPYQVKSTSNRGTFNPADPNIYKGLIPAVGAGGLLALVGPEEAEAAPYQFPADLPGYVNPEPGLGSPLVDVADILTAPIGAVGAGAKAAAMAAEPFVSYGMDKVINGLFDLFSDED